ncbi:zinc ribbon domain-containing protein [Cohnella sp. AR92]|uniref:zinc ribbon domain-containing protein n=1 Tax=Cohnella sp. AR92 TaxID=648716 RepID=UPI000F8C4B68|nr:zinc ribbon domain-containing protein [Cohnella sp. AR92]RUS43822.1 zinc ribbon domain-containing protein [Cohnella sp. AR92]
MSNFLDKFKNGAAKVADKAQQALEINRLNAQISNVRKDIEKNHSLMGQLAYEAYRNGDVAQATDKLVELSQQIDHHLATVAGLELKIREVKNEKACPGCNAVVAWDAKFCVSCGHKFEVVAATNVPVPAPAALIQHCSSCNEPLQPDSRFCENCGTPVSN